MSTPEQRLSLNALRAALNHPTLVVTTHTEVNDSIRVDIAPEESYYRGHYTVTHSIYVEPEGTLFTDGYLDDGMDALVSERFDRDDTDHETYHRKD